MTTGNGTDTIRKFLFPILLLGLTVLIGIVWSNVQFQIADNLRRVEDLVKMINTLEVQFTRMDSRMEYLQNQLDVNTRNIDVLDAEVNNYPAPTRPRFERK